MKMIFK